jgi:hypothetical protein
MLTAKISEATEVVNQMRLEKDQLIAELSNKAKQLTDLESESRKENDKV